MVLCNVKQRSTVRVRPTGAVQADERLGERRSRPLCLAQALLQRSDKPVVHTEGSRPYGCRTVTKGHYRHAIVRAPVEESERVVPPATPIEEIRGTLPCRC